MRIEYRNTAPHRTLTVNGNEYKFTPSGTPGVLVCDIPDDDPAIDTFLDRRNRNLFSAAGPSPSLNRPPVAPPKPAAPPNPVQDKVQAPPPVDPIPEPPVDPADDSESEASNDVGQVIAAASHLLSGTVRSISTALADVTDKAVIRQAIEIEASKGDNVRSTVITALDARLKQMRTGG